MMDFTSLTQILWLWPKLFEKEVKFIENFEYKAEFFQCAFLCSTKNALPQTFFTRHWLWNSWIVGLQALIFCQLLPFLWRPFHQVECVFPPRSLKHPFSPHAHLSNTVWWLAHTSSYQLLPLLWLSLGGTFISSPRFRNNPWPLTLVSDEKQQWHVVTYILTESSNVEIIIITKRFLERSKFL